MRLPDPAHSHRHSLALIIAVYLLPLNESSDYLCIQNRTALQHQAQPLAHCLNHCDASAQITGLALTGIMTVGYFFASPWPRRAPWFQSLLCAKWVNDFSVFYLTHVAMTISLVVLLICHPVPGRMNNDHHSTTWAYMLAGLIAYLSGNCIQYFRYGPGTE